MALRLSERQQAVLFAAVLIVAIGALYAVTMAVQPADVQAYVVHRVHLEVEGGGWTIRYEPDSTANNTAFSLLIEASTSLDFPVRYVSYQIPAGVFVTEINGSANGDDQRYWQYWVNGVYADVAADHEALHDDDIVLWRFSRSQEGA